MVSGVARDGAGDDDGFSFEWAGGVGGRFFGAGHMEADLAEVVDDVAGFGVVAEAVDGGGHDGSDVADFGELFLRGIEEGIDGVEVVGEDLSCAAADVGDSEGGEDAFEGSLAGFVEGVEEVFGGFLAHVFEGAEVVEGESVEVGDGVYEASIDELGDEGGSEAFDVHLVAGGEVADAGGELGGAVGVEAADVDAAFVTGDGSRAFGALVGEGEGFGFFVAFFG